MQSTTGVANYNECMVEVGKWAYSQGGPQAQTAYQTLYGLYLGSQPAVMSTGTPAQTGARTAGQQPRTQPQPRTGAAARQRPRTTAAASRQRVRTAPGQLGQVDAKVLTQIVANPNIAIEALRRRSSLRTMQANILGTCISRLLKGAFIAGTAKIGPFSATPQGISAVRTQPTALSSRRRTAAPPTERSVEQAAAAG